MPLVVLPVGVSSLEIMRKIPFSSSKSTSPKIKWTQAKVIHINKIMDKSTPNMAQISLIILFIIYYISIPMTERKIVVPAEEFYGYNLHRQKYHVWCEN